jgi:hypothetical protein
MASDKCEAIHLGAYAAAFRAAGVGGFLAGAVDDHALEHRLGRGVVENDLSTHIESL